MLEQEGSGFACPCLTLDVGRRAIITDVLGGELEFEFFHAWFNWIFLAAACASLLLLYARHQQQRDPADLPVFTKKP